MMNDNPFFSVVTINWNNLKGLVATYSSLRAQHFQDTEWIVIDGASTDGSESYLRSLEYPVRLVCEADDGIYDAMNKGLRMARGQYVVFMNSGDVFGDVDTLSKVYQCGNGADVIYGDSSQKDYRGDVRYKRARAPEALSYGMFACHQAMYFKSDFCQGLEYNSDRKIAGDYEFVSVLYMRDARFEYLNSSLAIFDNDGVSNRAEAIGRRENWAIQRDVLRLSIFRIVFNRVLYVLSSLMRSRFRPFYDFMRLKYDEN